MLFSIDEHPQIELFEDFRKIKNEDAFHHNHRSRFEGEHLWNDVRIIKGVLKLLNLFSVVKRFNILNKLVVVYALRKVKVFVAFFIPWLQTSFPVIVVLRQQTDLIFAKRIKQSSDEQCFTGSTSSGYSYHVWLFEHNFRFTGKKAPIFERMQDTGYKT